MNRLSDTAHEILQSLKRRGEATVADLKEEFGLSAMAIRHHLSTLRIQGFIQSSYQRGGVGRPSEKFRLTELGDELFPRHYDRFANDILETIELVQGKAGTDEILSQRKQRQLEKCSERLEGKSLEYKVAEVARILTEDGFLADYEKHGDDFLLTERNCSVSRIADQFNQVCECELSLITELLEADVTRKEHRIKGDCCCSYIIRERTAILKECMTIRNSDV